MSKYMYVFIFCFILTLCGCVDVRSTFEDLTPWGAYTLHKSEVKPYISQVVVKNTTIFGALSVPKSRFNISSEDLRTLNNSRTKQVVMLNKANTIASIGDVTAEELLYLWELSVDSYVESKTVINKYISKFDASEVNSFRLYEVKIKNKGDFIAQGLSEVSNKNVNELFNLIMGQASDINDLVLLLISS